MTHSILLNESASALYNEKGGAIQVIPICCFSDFPYLLQWPTLNEQSDHVKTLACPNCRGAHAKSESR